MRTCKKYKILVVYRVSSDLTADQYRDFTVVSTLFFSRSLRKTAGEEKKALGKLTFLIKKEKRNYLGDKIQGAEEGKNINSEKTIPTATKKCLEEREKNTAR